MFIRNGVPQGTVLGKKYLYAIIITFNPDINSDSPQAKSKRVRLLSANLETSQTKDKENSEIKT